MNDGLGVLDKHVCGIIWERLLKLVIQLDIKLK